MNIEKIQVIVKGATGFNTIEYNTIEEFRSNTSFELLSVRISAFTIFYTGGKKFTDSVRYTVTGAKLINESSQRKLIASTLYKFVK